MLLKCRDLSVSQFCYTMHLRGTRHYKKELHQWYRYTTKMWNPASWALNIVNPEDCCHYEFLYIERKM